MHGMQGFSAVADRRAVSTGTLLIALGGLALYQMTSLVLGPAGSRQLHLSLTVPAVDQDERNEWWTSGTNLSLGTVITASPAPAASARAASTVMHRASATVGAHPAAASATPVAVTPQPPVTQPAVHPTPPIGRLPVSQGDGQHGHEE